MFITKSNPNVEINGRIAADCEIKDHILHIKNYKYENNMWYVFGEDRKWYYLGLGANPSIEYGAVDNHSLALAVFEVLNEPTN